MVLDLKSFFIPIMKSLKNWQIEINAMFTMIVLAKKDKIKCQTVKTTTTIIK